MRNFKNIKAWQFADDLTVDIYKRTRGFPKEEIYGLTSQLRRAAYSVPSNIAEGAARDSAKDYLRFLYIARGSLAEAEYFCHLATRLEYLEHDAYATIQEQVKATFNILQGLIKSVESEAGIVGRSIAAVSCGLVLLFSRLGHVVA